MLPSHFADVTSLTLTLQEDEEMAARCETVLNTTMAEMDTYHTQKLEDFQDLAKEHLDGEIALYEQVANGSLSSPLTKYSVKEYWLRASLCALAMKVCRELL